MNFTQESIFLSTLRGFFKSIGVVLGVGLSLFLLVLGLAAVSNSVSSPDKSELKLSSDANWNRKLLPDSTPVILRMNVKGIIGTGNNKEEPFREMLLSSREGVLANNRVKGILLVVNSPGGTDTDSSGIYQLLKSYKEKFNVPIYAFVNGMCASGGIYIACAADKIFSTKESIIGSVGARIGPTFNFSDAMAKVGISSLTLTEGKDKDALNPFRPWKEGEDASFKAILADSYEQFLNVIVSNRKEMNKELLINDYGAQVFSAQKAREIGYVDDGDASYDLTLASLAKAAGIQENEKYQVLEIEPYQPVLRNLVENKLNIFNKAFGQIFPLAPSFHEELNGKILYLYQP